MSFHPEDYRLASVVMHWGLLEHERAEIPLEWIRVWTTKGSR